MQVRFKVNCGSRDASLCGLDFRDCEAGKSASVSQKVGEWLVESGVAEEVVTIHVPIAAVPDRPAIADAKPPEIQTVKPDAVTQPTAKHKQNFK